MNNKDIINELRQETDSKYAKYLIDMLEDDLDLLDSILENPFLAIELKQRRYDKYRTRKEIK